MTKITPENHLEDADFATIEPISEMNLLPKTRRKLPGKAPSKILQSNKLKTELPLEEIWDAIIVMPSENNPPKTKRGEFVTLLISFLIGWTLVKIIFLLISKKGELKKTKKEKRDLQIKLAKMTGRYKASAKFLKKYREDFFKTQRKLFDAKWELYKTKSKLETELVLLRQRNLSTATCRLCLYYETEN